MKLAPETREILRQYKAVINARRRENGQSALRTEQVIDEICYYMTCQHAHKTLAGWRLRERDGKLRFAPLPVISPSDACVVHLQPVSISVGGCDVLI